MGSCYAPALLRVIGKISLTVEVGLFADDLDGVLVGTDGSVASESVENQFGNVFMDSDFFSGTLIKSDLCHLLINIFFNDYFPSD